MADVATPAHLFTPDPAGEQFLASDDHRRVLARCNRGYPIAFSTLHDALAADPFTYGIGPNDEARLGQILGDLMADGDVTQNVHGQFEATEDGWEKITHNAANAEAGAK